MKKIAFLLMMPLIAYGENKQTLESYEKLPAVLEDYKAERPKETRKAPTQLLTKEDAEPDEAESKLKDVQKRLKNSIAMTEKELVPISRFFVDSENRLTCRNITIIDAGQEFHKNGRTYLHLRFYYDTLYGSQTDDFLNDQMRRAFAVYTSTGKEVAFHRPKNKRKVLRYSPDEVYDAEWTISLDRNKPLNDIECADRKFDAVLNPDGKYNTVQSK